MKLIYLLPLLWGCSGAPMADGPESDTDADTDTETTLDGQMAFQVASALAYEDGATSGTFRILFMDRDDILNLYIVTNLPLPAGAVENSPAVSSGSDFDIPF